jgi:hypothetical protein
MEPIKLSDDITAFELLTILKKELGEDKLIDIDCVHYNLEARGVDIEPKDFVSAVITFYNNPAPFYRDWHIFDKFVAAFCHYTIDPNTVHKNNMFEVVRAILDAKKIVDTYIKNLSDLKFSSEVLTYIAALAHDEGLVVCPPEISYTGLQEYMDRINHNITSDMKDKIIKIYNDFLRVYTTPDFVKILDRDIDDFTIENAVKLLSITIYAKKYN